MIDLMTVLTALACAVFIFVVLYFAMWARFKSQQADLRLYERECRRKSVQFIKPKERDR